MKNLRSWLKTMAGVACAALMLSLLAGECMGGTKPLTTRGLWPNGAKIETSIGWSDLKRSEYLVVMWPKAEGADHYRVTWRIKSQDTVFVADPVYATGYTMWGNIWSGSWIIAVTAYSSPDETTANSETIQSIVKVQFQFM